MAQQSYKKQDLTAIMFHEPPTTPPTETQHSPGLEIHLADYPRDTNILETFPLLSRLTL